MVFVIFGKSLMNKEDEYNMLARVARSYSWAQSERNQPHCQVATPVHKVIWEKDTDPKRGCLCSCRFLSSFEVRDRLFGR